MSEYFYVWMERRCPDGEGVEPSAWRPRRIVPGWDKKRVRETFFSAEMQGAVYPNEEHAVFRFPADALERCDWPEAKTWARAIGRSSSARPGRR